ncbi:MAG: FctA domain-containing protein [Lachnospiraceae bacterium]|nr:FctA domain-containing protein [Lachnospiraceae bacterium]
MRTEKNRALLFPFRMRAGVLVLLGILAVLFCFPCSAEAAVPVSVRIPVTCSGGKDEENCVIVMEMETEEQQTVDQLQIRLKPGEEGAFSIHYVVPDTYHYRIRQEAGSDRDVIYDSRVYEVEVFVTEDDKGQLHGETVVSKMGTREKSAAVHFENSVKSTPVKGNPPVKPVNVQTGDSQQPLLYVAFLLASMVTVLYLGAEIRKKKGAKGHEKE